MGRHRDHRPDGKKWPCDFHEARNRNIGIITDGLERQKQIQSNENSKTEFNFPVDGLCWYCRKKKAHNDGYCSRSCKNKAHSSDAKSAGRRFAPGWMRQLILTRDKYHCRYCGTEVTNETANIDHVVPWPEGMTIIENLATCCRNCNEKKKTSKSIQWQKKIRRVVFINKEEKRQHFDSGIKPPLSGSYKSRQPPRKRKIPWRTNDGIEYPVIIHHIDKNTNAACSESVPRLEAQ